MAREHQNSPAVLRKPPPVERRKIFSDGCPNRQCYAGTGFRANRRERTSGPDEGGGAAKQKDGVCPTTLDRAECPDQKEEFAVSAIESDKPALSRHQPEGLWWHGRRSAATSTNACGGRAEGPRRQVRMPVVAGHKVRGDWYKACCNRKASPGHSTLHRCIKRLGTCAAIDY